MSSVDGSLGKVLVLSSSFPKKAGSYEGRAIFELHERLAKEGIGFLVLAPYAKGTKRREEIGGLEVHRFRYFLPGLERLCYGGGIRANLGKSFFAKLQLPFFVFFMLVSVFLVCRREKIRFIHAHWAFPQGLVAFFYKFFSKKPYVLTCHGSDVHSSSRLGLGFFLRRIVSSSAQTSVVSEALLERLLAMGCPKDRVSVIPLGFDRSVFRPAERSGGGRVVLSVGRLSGEKGFDVLIKAMPGLLEKFEDLSFWIVGEGSEKEKLLSLAREENVLGSLRFLSPLSREKLSEIYRSATVFVIPSREEGLPLVLLEALASGLPVVATRVGGIPSVVRDGYDCYLVEKDDAASLEKAIAALLDDGAKRRMFAENGLRAVEVFSWGNVVGKYLGVYGSLLS